jgi:serine phosphatase RsbU (regulator of sigma subunit)
MRLPFRVAPSGGWYAEPQVSAWLAVPLALVIAVPVADHFLPPDIHLAHLLAVAPAFTAAIAGTRLTAMISALAVLALIAAGAERDSLTTENVLVQLGSLIALSALMVLFTVFRARRTRELARVRRVSDAAQRVVLRPLPARAGPLSIASAYRAFDADSTIGGDLYAVTRACGSTRVVIGDVRGKGLASIGSTAIMLGTFRALAHRQLPLPELAAHLEGAVRWDTAENAGPETDALESFVTAVIAEIPDDEPVVHLISCGHPAPLLLRRTGASLLTVPEPAPPVGLGWMSATPYVPVTFPFDQGDQLLLYTDGVTETRDQTGAFYPLAERVTAWPDGAPADLVRKITDDLVAYAATPLNDDMALVVVQRDEPPAASRAETGSEGGWAREDGALSVVRLRG